MIYECLVVIASQNMLMAKIKPGDWTSGERSNPPYELVDSPELFPETQDYDVDLVCSFGTLTVKASKIDPSLVKG
jgi:hypothetical protein